MRLLVCTLLLVLLSGLSRGNVHVVNDLGDPTPSTGGTMTLRQAINAANPGDTIRIAVSGSIRLDGSEGPLRVQKELSIIGPHPIHMELDGSDVAKILEVDMSDPGDSLAVYGIQMSKVSGSSSALHVKNGKLRLSEVMFQRNQGNRGAGVYNQGGEVTLVNSAFIGNTAANDGGGVAQSGGSMRLVNCTFFGDTATNGGGVYVSGGSLYMLHNTIADCRASDSGGGINNAGGTVTISHTMVARNSAPNGNDLAGNIETDGHNLVTSDPNNSGIIPELTDVIGLNVDPGLANTPRRNGYGSFYLPIVSDASDAIDAGNASSPSDLNKDCRRAPRELDGSENGSRTRDIGAVEYTPFRVTSDDQTGTGALPGSVRPSVNNSNGEPPFYIAFDIPSSQSTTITHSLALRIERPVVIDGYSQTGSRVAGPGRPPLEKDSITPAIPLVTISGQFNNNSGFIFEDNAKGSELRGMTIQDHNFNGISITVDSIVVKGNHIGTDTAGMNARGNNRGIRIQNSSGNRIGKRLLREERNVISGNDQTGILVEGPDNDSNVIQGNFIGTGAKGKGALGNGSYGIVLEDARETGIGGTAPTPRGNLISGNSATGVLMRNSSEQNALHGNLIGTNIYREKAVPNENHGIALGENARSNRIGGKLSQGAGNLISGNGGNGILIRSGDNRIQGNLIGMTGKGKTLVISNKDHGIELSSGGQNRIGGNNNTRNTISGNEGNGIYIHGSIGPDNKVLRNFIGTDIRGGDPKGNMHHGILLENCDEQVRIGNATVAGRNIIADNDSAGVAMQSNNAGHIVRGNNIGRGRDPGDTMGNRTGIHIRGDDHIIGLPGADPGKRNRIIANQNEGILISQGDGNTMTTNRIAGNGKLGIDLGGDGPTPNDPGDNDPGANLLKNTADLDTASLCGQELTVTGSYNSIAFRDYRVEYYRIPAGKADPSGYGEGNQYLGADTVFTNSSGNTALTFNYSGPIQVDPGDSLTALVTDLDNSNSSEFARNIPVQPSLRVSTKPRDLSCKGAADGRVKVLVSTGKAPYQIVLKDSATGGTVKSETTTMDSLVLDSLQASTYFIVAEDSLGCTDSSDHFRIDAPSSIKATIDPPTDTFCQSAVDTLNAQGSGGTPPYSYSWSGDTGPLSDTNIADPLFYSSSTGTFTLYLTVSDSAGCSARDTATYMVKMGATANAGADQSICPSDTPSVSGTIGGMVSDGKWHSTGDGSFSDPDSLATKYFPGPGDTSKGQVRLVLRSDTPQGDCPSARDTMLVSFFDPPTADAGPDQGICNGDSVELSGSGGIDYTWTPSGSMNDPNTQSPLAYPDTTTTFSLAVNDQNGCSDTDSVTISVSQAPPAPDAEGGGTFCADDSIPDMTASPSSGGQIRWYSDSLLTDQVGTGLSQPVPNTAGTYRFYITESVNGCEGSADSVVVEVLPTPLAPAVSPSQISYCPEDSVQALEAFPSDSNSVIRWYEDSVLSTPLDSGITFMPSPEADTNRYYVTETRKGCEGPPRKVTVILRSETNVTAGPDTTICAGDTIELQSSGGDAYDWGPHPSLSDTNVSTPKAFPQQTVTYKVRIVDNGGCEYRREVTVQVRSTAQCDSLHIYNSFTPDGDGTNDRWYIEHISKYPDNKVTILNQWGDRVNRFEGYDNQNVVWRGRNENGKELPAGTYYYILKIPEKGKVFNGWVEILR